jgi:hypothetical protein
VQHLAARAVLRQRLRQLVEATILVHDNLRFQ